MQNKDLQQAISLYEEKKYKEALPIFEKLKDENISAYNYLGLCYLGLNDLDKALYTFEQGWYRHNRNKVFIDNLIYTSVLFYNANKNNRNDCYYKPVGYLKQYIQSRHTDNYRYEEVYHLLGLFADLEDFNEKKTLEYFQKAYELNSESKANQQNLSYIKQKIKKSIFADEFVLAPHIVEIFDSLKKPCQVIIKELFEEIECDNEEEYHIFSINNFEGLNFPKEIKRLEVYFNDEEYELFYKIRDDFGIDKEKNIEVKNSYNLPDLKTLEELYPQEYKKVFDYFISLSGIDTKKVNPNDYFVCIEGRIYEQLVKKYLGYDLPTTFIGGNINQMYVDLYDYKELNFIMQYGAGGGNGDIIFVFSKKDNLRDLVLMVQH